MSLLYQDSPIEKDFTLFKAYVCYIGNQDLEKKDIIKTIRLELPEKTKIYDCKIVSHTNGLEINKETLNDRINFNFDLLKSGELFYFEVLLDLSNSDERHDFKISSRISGLDIHKTIDYHLENYKLLRDTNWSLYWGFIWSLLLWMIDVKNIKPFDERLYNYKKDFYYEGKTIDQDSMYSLLHKYNGIVNSKSFENLSTDSLKYLNSISKNLDLFLNADKKADFLLKGAFKAKVDWSDIKSYNIFRESTDIIQLSNKYTVKFKNRFFWLDLIFILYTLSGFIFMPLELKRINKYSKIQPAIDLIREYKKKQK